MNNALPAIKLDDVDILSFGNSTQIAGVIWSNISQRFVTLLPNKVEDFSNLSVMPLTLQEWQRVIRQTDILEVEMFSQDPSGIIKTIVRKTQRQIDQRMQWACYARDDYTCRYCGRINTFTSPLPLTVDHIILWEKQGVTVLENLLAACRACNSDRGNMEYDAWINSEAYRERSKNLPEQIKQLNLAIISQLDYLRSLTSIRRKSR